MAKKKRTPQEEVAFLAAGITTEIDHWLALKEIGCRDPFTSDGVNMNLTRNHILHDHSEIERLCAENSIELPEEYHYAVPPEVNMDYMAPNLHYPERLENQYTKLGKTAVRTCPDYDPYQTEQEETPTLPEPPPAQQIMSAAYTKAVTLHRRICANAQAAQESLYEMCKALKEMRDGKLYKELGYSSFEDYTKTEIGMSREHARRYITIYNEFENATSMWQIGSTKLMLLAKLDEPERAEIVQSTDLESTSVRELKAEIEKLRSEKSGYKERQDKLLQKNKELVSDLQRTEDERDRLEENLEEARDTAHSLEKQLEDLENRPVEVAVKPEKIPDLEAVFAAYTQNAVDAMKRLVAFCENNSDYPERKLFIAKLSSIVTLTNRTIERLKGV